MKYSLFLFASLLSLTAPSAEAQMTLKITGSPSSSIITFSANGSTTFSGDIGLQTPGIGSFFALDSVLAVDIPGVHPFVSGNLVASNDSTGNSLILDGVTLRKNGVGQNLDYVSPINTIFDAQLYFPGQTASWSGTADLDLAPLGRTWADFVQGTHLSITTPLSFDTSEPVTLIIEEVSEFTDLCNGDGGDQMGCADCPCNNNAPTGTIGGCMNSAGTSSRLIATGDTSISLPSGDTTDLRFQAEGMPATAFGVLVSGDAVAPNNMANPCFGMNSGIQSAQFDGLRCVVGQTQRHGGRSANGFGVINDSAGPNRVWGGEAQPADGLGVQAGFVAGQTRYFQINHREDAALVCMRGLNTSQAVEVTFTP